ncbi:hypothetical protein PQX77_003506 [Marasmius sp. AFHP31]|nr:hypothetical protein PQX77_003506 [Marasmius sp. AFHP31]
MNVLDIVKNGGLTGSPCIDSQAQLSRLLKQEAELRSREFEANPCLKKREGTGKEFGLDCHGPSLENIFVDEQDPTKITCIIDWESTTTRPLWQVAHLPAFLQSSPFTAKLFRKVLVKMAADVSAQTSSSNGIKSQSSDPLPSDFGTLTHE